MIGNHGTAGLSKGYRSKVIPIPRSLRARRSLPILYDPSYDPNDRPKNRSECIDGPRPCPYVSCRFHLYLDVNPNGSLKINFPHLEPEEIPQTCALDVADSGQHTLEHIGSLLNMTFQGVREMAAPGMHKMRVAIDERYEEMDKALNERGRKG